MFSFCKELELKNLRYIDLEFSDDLLVVVS